MFQLSTYPDFASLSEALTGRWIALIEHTPDTQSGHFALAGGTTPAPVYRQLDLRLSASKKNNVVFVATDERWVPNDDPQSNEGLFQRCFSQSTGQWQLVSLKNNALDPIAAMDDINARLHTACPDAFQAIILGMGTDGHIASLFPNASQLLVDDPTKACVAALHPQSQQARMSLSFSRLLNTNHIWLIITGHEKRTVLETASPQSPIGALLAAAKCPVEVFWCP